MRDLGSHVPAQRADLIPPPWDRRIAALADEQHGVATRAQLCALGLGDSAIGRRLTSGRLHAVHHGVYAVGHRVLTARGRWMAAVLACGPAAALSHASAGALWELRASAAVIVDVTVPRTGSRKRPGLRIHRPRTIGSDEIATHDGIPVTTPARTILDLAATLQRRPLERLLDSAENARLTDVASLDALARAHAGHRGASRLLEALSTHVPGTTVTRSDLEERFLALCRQSGLPGPQVNADVAGRERDFVFPEQRLVVEIDSWRYHRSRHAFEDDRYRDATLLLAGYRTLRVTDTQLEYEPHVVAATVRAALGGQPITM
jgi:very-short-patch-repair endonuclease/predicted transcriptional regulator of viral defense system